MQLEWRTKEELGQGRLENISETGVSTQFSPATSLSQKGASLAKLMVCPGLDLTPEKSAEL